MKEQRYKISRNTLYQDNQEAMLIEKNGQNLCTGNSRNINIRYFFVKDRVDKKEIAVEYCPIYLMVADFFTKPLQGRMFRLFWEAIMGYRSMEEIISEISIKKRVGNNDKNRIVSENSNSVIEKSRYDAQAHVLDKLTTKIVGMSKSKKKVSWKDEMK